MTDFLSKINQLDARLNIELVHQQVVEINNIVATIRQKQVLKRAPKKLGFLPDVAEEICSNHFHSKDQLDDFKTINQLLNNTRQFLAIKFGLWSIPNLETAQVIKDQLKINKGLEIMAGNGYWSKALSQVGVKMTATDNLDWSRTSNTGAQAFVPVSNYDAARAVKQFSDVDLIICSWAPNFGNSDEKVVNAWQKLNSATHLLFVGERNGVTNSASFWQKEPFLHSKELRLINQTFTSFDFIDEQIFEIAHEI
ncbi:SAM-dependent methyltransferase [Lactobacillus sp. ESL0260]|uniref:SAM-dependent methyltransferase n=1 Tax=Lactobacillus sp. ESL0260 TaxID=2069347 RepID=UPI000EFA6E14|nr:SAM-dependent methyltransferase [Lactobacillus sp. ESL0260]RMC57590.1 SAM-dependent methyltransferase [Lactobacillus sp. ESL0260]